MAERVCKITLSTSSLGGLEKALETTVREIPTAVNEGIYETSMSGADMVMDTLFQAAATNHIDGNLLGKATGAQPTKQRGRVLWTGDQISYIEFGTGARGAKDRYPGRYVGGYRPDPEKERWYYFKKNHRYTSLGLGAIAPLWYAARALRVRGTLGNRIRIGINRTLPRGRFR